MDRNRDVWQFLDGVASDNVDMRNEGIARRTIRDLIELYEITDTDALRQKIARAQEVLRHAVPGQPRTRRHPAAQGDDPEYEAECIWGYFGWNCSNVMHLRLGFYTGDIFTEEPTVERDVEPILETARGRGPRRGVGGLRPRGQRAGHALQGPAGHDRRHRAVRGAESGRDDLKIWGYRNVWYRFHPAEANVYVPSR
jgi:glucosamine-6-phosphate deaminase